MAVPERYDDPLFAICDRYSSYSSPRAIFMLFNPSQTGGGAGGGGEAAFEALLTLKLNNFKTVQAMRAKLIDFS